MNFPQKLFNTIIYCFVRFQTKYSIWVWVLNDFWQTNLIFDFWIVYILTSFIFFLRIWQQTPYESLKFIFVLPFWNLNRFTLYTFVLHANGVSSAFLPISCQWPHDRPIEAFRPSFLGLHSLAKVRPAFNK